MIVALHDPVFVRVAKGSALVGKLVMDVQWANVKELDVGSWKGAKFTAMAGKPERRLYLDIKALKAGLVVDPAADRSVKRSLSAEGR